MVGTTNDYSQKEGWQDHNNEIIFQLPRDLINLKGTVVIKGEIIKKTKRLKIGFMSGAANSAKKPLYYIIFDYGGDKIIFENVSQNEEEEIDEVSGLHESDFNFQMTFLNNDQGGINLVTKLGGYEFSKVCRLSGTGLRENIFLSINEDTLKITQLDFKWKDEIYS